MALLVYTEFGARSGWWAQFFALTITSGLLEKVHVLASVAPAKSVSTARYVKGDVAGVHILAAR